MLSVLMPYWRRADLLARTLVSFGVYEPPGIQVVVVNDGDKPPSAPGCDLINLPAKTEPLNPCVPLNAGAAAARFDILCLTGCEVEHISPVLEEMRRTLVDMGPMGYVSAAVWDSDRQKWFAHSSRRPPSTPPDFPLHFCTMLHRSLFDEAGGFDEGYRDGAGWEDNDFAYRLHAAGAIPYHRDDLVVYHHRTRCHWPPQAFETNRHRFMRKWG